MDQESRGPEKQKAIYQGQGNIYNEQAYKSSDWRRQGVWNRPLKCPWFHRYKQCRRYVWDDCFKRTLDLEQYSREVHQTADIHSYRVDFISRQSILNFRRSFQRKSFGKLQEVCSRYKFYSPTSSYLPSRWKVLLRAHQNKPKTNHYNIGRKWCR